jgi:hypothetical protein
MDKLLFGISHLLTTESLQGIKIGLRPQVVVMMMMEVSAELVMRKMRNSQL